ncbi:nucleoside-diphosphate-sugar epimerase [Nicoletella semolina]|uniref:Nucleoside-diphosphate-sugar epimerase n=1 Tax=Nicoletella semolina TaxID=271160 RepID=A0A4R2NBL1_9PAST|nr:NAD(P)-dependent oxidoreductase [Nicoletella semolina]MDH2924892.1 hypothetical protein [Nicoletella semolina]TCP18434.1 nucleoside-diphosphate-sugar epimerase [Nicoletella semolina]
MKLNIIILGATGFIGKEVSNYLDATGKYNVIRHSRSNVGDDRFLCCDIGDDVWRHKIKEVCDPIIINCAGIGLAKLKSSSVQNNTLLAHKLVNSLNISHKKYKLIYLSSIKVFNPNNYDDFYSIDKLRAEDILIKSGLFCGEIIRLPVVTGKNDKNFIPLTILSKMNILFGVKSKLPSWHCISNVDVAKYIEMCIDSSLFEDNRLSLKYLLSTNKFNINDFIVYINKINGKKTRFISLRNMKIIFNFLSIFSLLRNKMKFSSLPKERFLDLFIRKWEIEEGIKSSEFYFNQKEWGKNYE